MSSLGTAAWWSFGLGEWTLCVQIIRIGERGARDNSVDQPWRNRLKREDGAELFVREGARRGLSVAPRRGDHVGTEIARRRLEGRGMMGSIMDLRD